MQSNLHAVLCVHFFADVTPIATTVIHERDVMHCIAQQSDRI